MNTIKYLYFFNKILYIYIKFNIRLNNNTLIVKL